jgi:hypothetical protein
MVMSQRPSRATIGVKGLGRLFTTPGLHDSSHPKNTLGGYCSKVIV